MSQSPAEVPSVDEILTSIRRMMSEETAAPVSATPQKVDLKEVSPASAGLKNLFPETQVARMQGVMDATAMEALVSRLLQPLLKAWLNENLPILVERILRQEMKK